MTVGKVNVVRVVADRMHQYDTQWHGFSHRQHGKDIRQLFVAGCRLVYRLRPLFDALRASAVVTKHSKRNGLFDPVAPLNKQTAVVGFFQPDGNWSFRWRWILGHFGSVN